MWGATLGEPAAHALLLNITKKAIAPFLRTNQGL